MATERELQVACLWGLQNIAFRELQEEIINLSPGTQVNYSLLEDVLVIKGCFDDDTEAAVVACIKNYVKKHMHHNLPDVSTLLGSTSP
ncbi:hypothetical protein PENSUB_6072 [Penicillium subrubescens]|uniref:Uncharacterized protein n=1 Tax=Penicillium subrubescens TaxID=1316194 RepID=A0A1Q5U4S4_9EURO|nr:hypothetical protein PENSUB_6072 [Penicillium subrubescens]